MGRYVLRALVSRFRSDLVLTVLTVLGVALGVASVLSIRILSSGATGAFSGTVEALGSDVGFSVVGERPSVPDSLLAVVHRTPGVAVARPIVERAVSLADDPTAFLDVFAIDLLRPPPLPTAASEAPAFDVVAAIHTPGWAAVTPAAADEHGWSIGDSVRVSSGSTFATLVIGAVVDFSRTSALAAPNLVLMDIAQAGRLFGGRDRVTRIDVVVAPGADLDDVTRRLGRALPAGTRVVTPERRVEEANNLLGAFRLNLFALSLVSLVVGSYLVYGAVSASLARRRRELGVLRSLGATRVGVVGVIVSEVLVLAGLGALVGIPLGYAAAVRNVDKVSDTVSNLYLLKEIRTLSLSPDSIALGLAVGFGAALAAVVVPTLEIARRPVRELLSAAAPRARLRERAGRLALVAGVGSVVGLVGFRLVGTTWRPSGFALALGTLVVITLATPAVIRTLSRRCPRRGFGVSFSIANLSSRLGSAATAVSALAASVSMVVGVTVMVTSFRTSLVTWIDRTVRADVYVTTPSWGRSPADATIDPEIVDALERRVDVEWMDRLRQTTITSPDGRLRVSGVDFSVERRGRMSRDERMELVAGTVEGLLDRLVAGGAIISEPLARKRGLAVGDSLVMSGVPDRVRIEGVYTDYSSEWGAALLHLDTYERLFGPGDPESVALYLDDPSRTESVVEAIRAEFADRSLDIRSNRRLREESLALFDQTFAITDLLKAMAALVAIFGITLTLLIWTRERGRELALYRALGASPPQLFRLFVGEGVSLGLLGIALGLVGGVALAWILVGVINRSYFGWTIQISWPWADVGVEMLGILAAAVVASLYPAIVARRVSPVSLTEERQ